MPRAYSFLETVPYGAVLYQKAIRKQSRKLYEQLYYITKGVKFLKIMLADAENGDFWTFYHAVACIFGKICYILDPEWRDWRFKKIGI